MSKDQVKFSNGMLTLTAKKVAGQPDATHGGKKIKINYLSGAIHAKEHFNVSRGGGYDFTGEFKATTTKGTWPAFWLTAVDGWPPEIDMAEWKGSGKIVSNFNMFPVCPRSVIIGTFNARRRIFEALSDAHVMLRTVLISGEITVLQHVQYIFDSLMERCKLLRPRPVPLYQVRSTGYQPERVCSAHLRLKPDLP
jgi:hypothetical protein